jgi:hypothetical protein
VAWDKRRAQHLTRGAQHALRRLQSKLHKASNNNGLSARMEVLMAEKRAAYEARNMERYEAAIQAIVHQARAACPETESHRTYKSSNL